MATAELALYERNSLALWKPAWGGKLFQWIDKLVPDEVIVGIEQIARYDELLNARVETHYSRERVSEVIEDEEFLASMDQAIEGGETIATAWPWFRSPLWLFLPKRAILLDRELRQRTQRMIRSLNETMAGLQKLQPKQRGSAHHRTKALAFMEDPDVPTAVAKRLLAGIRGRITLDLCLTKKAREEWSLADTKRALIDWMDSTEDSLGFLASIPGMEVPSLPRERLFDLEAVVKKHQERRARLAGEALRAVGELS